MTYDNNTINSFRHPHFLAGQTPSDGSSLRFHDEDGDGRLSTGDRIVATARTIVADDHVASVVVVYMPLTVVASWEAEPS